MTAGDRLSSTTLLALLRDRPSVPFSSLPEWTWGLTRPCKTNNTPARPSLFAATWQQLSFQLTVCPCSTRLSIIPASSIIPWPSPPGGHESERNVEEHLCFYTSSQSYAWWLEWVYMNLRVFDGHPMGQCWWIVGRTGLHAILSFIWWFQQWHPHSSNKGLQFVKY